MAKKYYIRRADIFSATTAMKKTIMSTMLAASMVASMCTPVLANEGIHMTYSDNKLTIYSTESATATLVHAAYENERMTGLDLYDGISLMEETSYSIEADEDDKFMLWDSLTGMKPLCDALIVTSVTPSESPTTIPTDEPTAIPTSAPTAEPTATPSPTPTAEPTIDDVKTLEVRFEGSYLYLCWSAVSGATHYAVYDKDGTLVNLVPSAANATGYECGFKYKLETDYTFTVKVIAMTADQTITSAGKTITVTSPTPSPTPEPIPDPDDYKWEVSKAYASCPVNTELMTGLFTLFADTRGTGEYITSRDNGKWNGNVASGTALKYVAWSDGVLTIDFNAISAGKPVYVREEGSSSNAIVSIETDSTLSGMVKFNVKKDFVYYIYAEGTKLRFTSASFEEGIFIPTPTPEPTPVAVESPSEITGYSANGKYYVTFKASPTEDYAADINGRITYYAAVDGDIWMSDWLRVNGSDLDSSKYRSIEMIGDIEPGKEYEIEVGVNLIDSSDEVVDSVFTIAVVTWIETTPEPTATPTVEPTATPTPEPTEVPKTINVESHTNSFYYIAFPITATYDVTSFDFYINDIYIGNSLEDDSRDEFWINIIDDRYDFHILNEYFDYYVNAGILNYGTENIFTVKDHDNENINATVTFMMFDAPITTPTPTPIPTSGECGDNATWTFDEETGTLTISGEGEMWDNPPDRLKIWYNLDIINVKVEKGITYIGKNAFSTLDNLEKIKISDSVTAIGSEAISGCRYLNEIIIPEGVISLDVGAIYYCDGLTEVTLPNSIVNIGEYLFAGCESLERINISTDLLNYYTEEEVFNILSSDNYAIKNNPDIIVWYDAEVDSDITTE